jgi:hypothetical protein
MSERKPVEGWKHRKEQGGAVVYRLGAWPFCCFATVDPGNTQVAWSVELGDLHTAEAGGENDLETAQIRAEDTVIALLDEAARVLGHKVVSPSAGPVHCGGEACARPLMVGSSLCECMCDACAACETLGVYVHGEIDKVGEG